MLGEGARRQLLGSPTRNARRRQRAEPAVAMAHPPHTSRSGPTVRLRVADRDHRLPRSPGQLGPQRRVDLGHLSGFLRLERQVPTASYPCSGHSPHGSSAQNAGAADTAGVSAGAWPRTHRRRPRSHSAGPGAYERDRLGVGVRHGAWAPSPVASCLHPRHHSPALDAGFAGPTLPAGEAFPRHGEAFPAGAAVPHLIAGACPRPPGATRRRAGPSVLQAERSAVWASHF